MLNWKTADPSRRIPVYLQAHTKENFIWQLKMTVVVTAGLMAYTYIEDEIEERKRRRWTE